LGLRWGSRGALVAAACGVAVLSGCTTTIALKPPSGYLDFGYRGGEGREVRVVTPFEDERVRGKCPGDVKPDGDVRSKSVLPSAEEQLRCSDEPPGWFAERLIKALHGAGYTVIGIDEPGKGDVLEIRGALRSLTVESMAMMQSAIFEADVSLELRVSTTSGLVARRGFFVKASISKYGGGMGTLQDVLDESSTRAVRDMTAAIVSLTNRYPAMPLVPIASAEEAPPPVETATEASP